LPVGPGDPKTVRVAISADGRTVAVASGAKLALWDGSLHAANGPGAPVAGVAISPDGKVLVAAAGNDLWVWHWDKEKGQLSDGASHAAHTSAVTAIAFVPGLNRWVSGSQDGSAIIWEIP